MAEYDDYSSSDYFDMPSWDTQSDFPTFGSDVWDQFSTPYADTYDPWAGATWQNSMLSPEVTGSVNTSQAFPAPPGGYGNAGGGIPQPPSAMNIQAQGGLYGQPGGFLNALTTPQSLLGLGGGLAGLIGTLAGGGKGATSQPQPTTAQQANMGIGNQWAQMANQGQLPLQQQQMSLFNALASGQGLPPGYQQLIEQAYQPQLGDLYTQAVNAGRSRGFYDSPATAPPGGAILGPGLSNIQGQMAQSKLNLMQSLPQIYNQPIATQGGFAQNYLRAAQGAPMAQTSQQPLAPQIGAQIGAGLQGLGSAIGQNQQMQQQQAFQNSLLQALQNRSPYEFSGYSGV